jgi:hypothetical protein
MQLYKFIKSIVQFTIVLIPIYLLAILFCGKIFPPAMLGNLRYSFGPPTDTYFRLKEAQQFKDVDILFLGSSRAYRGFDTRIFNNAGYNSFNLGTSAQKPIQTEIILSRYLERLNPKIVVFEVCPAIFSGESIESSIDILTNSKLDKHSFSLLCKSKNIITLNCFIAEVYKSLFHSTKLILPNQVKGQDVYIKGGFVQSVQKFNAKTKEEQNDNLSINPDQQKAFENIIALLKQKKIKVILVQAPTMNAFYKNYPYNNNFDSKMRSYSSYVNFNKILKLNESINFYDVNHLTQTGVEIFNHELVDYIKKQ